MTELFADLTEATEASVEIAMRCAYRPLTQKAHLAALLRPRRRGGRRRAGAAPPGARGARGPSRPSRPRPRLRAAAIRRTARLRARRHRQDEIPRLFPHRRRLHPVGEGARHPGRAGPRLGRRLARRLGADHHRPRSDALRPPVRALPQPGARVDAGLRHRLLPGPARRGDRLRARALRRATGWRRSSPSARSSRAESCATSAACSKCRSAKSTSSPSSCR